jgi:hypothetical protein
MIFLMFTCLYAYQIKTMRHSNHVVLALSKKALQDNLFDIKNSGFHAWLLVITGSYT